jgi:hypothetical protein
MDLATAVIAMSLLPVAWLAIRRAWGHRLDASWWWIAGAFGISWLADVTSEHLPNEYRWAISLAYPVSQTALIGRVFMPRRFALVFLASLVTLGIIAAVWNGASEPDLMLRSVAWLSIVAMVWLVEMPTRLRVCLLVYFGLGLAAWMAHLRWVQWARAHPLLVHGPAPTMYVYQAVRLVGLLLFCWAAAYDGGDQPPA